MRITAADERGFSLIDLAVRKIVLGVFMSAVINVHPQPISLAGQLNYIDVKPQGSASRQLSENVNRKTVMCVDESAS